MSSEVSFEQGSVPRVRRPDLATFRRDFEQARRPVVITGAMESWPAMKRWSPQYFAESFADQPLPVSICEEEPPDNAPFTPEQLMKSRVVKMVMREYLDEMNAGKRRSYVPGMPLRKHLPMLLADIEEPPYREEGATSSPRIWFGARVVGPLHYDPSNNLHGIVYGGKRFTVFDPSQLSKLYPSSMFSSVPHMSRASLAQPDYARFPRLKKARALTIDLYPGDMLFLPAGWWHQVTTPSATISIDFPWEKNANLGIASMRLQPSKWLSKIRGRLGYGR